MTMAYATMAYWSDRNQKRLATIAMNKEKDLKRCKLGFVRRQQSVHPEYAAFLLEHSEGSLDAATRPACEVSSTIPWYIDGNLVNQPAVHEHSPDHQPEDFQLPACLRKAAIVLEVFPLDLVWFDPDQDNALVIRPDWSLLDAAGRYDNDSIATAINTVAGTGFSSSQVENVISAALNAEGGHTTRQSSKNFKAGRRNLSTMEPDGTRPQQTYHQLTLAYYYQCLVAVYQWWRAGWRPGSDFKVNHEDNETIKGFFLSVFAHPAFSKVENGKSSCWTED